MAAPVTGGRDYACLHGEEIRGKQPNICSDCVPRASVPSWEADVDWDTGPRAFRRDGDAKEHSLSLILNSLVDGLAKVTKR